MIMPAELPPVFAEFLETLSFIAPADAKSPLLTVRREVTCHNAQGEHYTEPPINVWQTGGTKLTLTGARQYVIRRLQAIDHVATEEIADALLGCVVGFAATGQERADFLQTLLNHPRTVDTSHFHILPTEAMPSLGKPAEFAGYTLGRLNFEALAARCRRAQCDFALRYEDRLRNRYALQSPVFRRVLLDPLSPSMPHLIAKPFWCKLVQAYVEQIARQHTEAMWLHLADTQVLARPFSAHVLDIAGLKSGGLGDHAEKVTVYLGIAAMHSAGYVVPVQGTVVVHQVDANSECLSRFQTHASEYRLEEHGDTPLARVAKICADFCQEAIRRLEAGNNNEASLYATIALEHLFSTKQNTLASVASRTAVLTHLRMGLPGFAETEDEVKRLYDARSRFVHAGTPCSTADAARLIDYARETIRSLLVLHVDPQNRHSSFLDQWVKNLDWIVSGIRAGQTFTAELLADNGIFAHSQFS